MRSLWLDTHRSPSTSDPFTPGTHYDTVVVGAGITGLTTAVLLARSGQKVGVVEARSTGAVATGNTTAKLSLLQGTTLSQIRHHQSDKVLNAYVEANREGQAWLLRHLEDHGVPYQLRTAYTYAITQEGTDTLREEMAACQVAGVSTVWTAETELPFPVSGALSLEDQAQFHPMDVLATLAEELRRRGGHLMEGARVTGAGVRTPLSVKTTQGDLEADKLVLATGTPILDRGGYFAKLAGHRSYALSFRVPQQLIPQGMYLSADAPDRTLRSVPLEDEELLLVGGNDHIVGRTSSHQHAVDDLVAWTEQNFPGAERTHAWSAQDYRSVNLIPFFGTLPRGGGNIYLATGFNKWGMTNGVAAALAITAQILGGSPSWATTMGHRITTPSDVVTAAKDTLAVGKQMASGWTSAERATLPDQAPPEGRGVVGRRAGRPVAVSTVEGTTCAVSAVCPHMGGILEWNDAELSWDCPLHASRFAPDGTLLEGPAVQDLEAKPFQVP